MDAAHRRRETGRVVDDGADLGGVHPGHQGGHEHDPQPGRGRVADGRLLDRAQVAAAQGLVAGRAQAVELEEDRGQPGFLQLHRVVRVGRQPQAVGVQLDKAEPLAPRQRDDRGEILAHRRLAAGQLEVARSARREHPVVEKADPRKRGLLVRVPARVGKADRAAQVAAPGDLDQGGAGVLAVGRAQAAVKGAAALHPGGSLSGRGRLFRPLPVGKGRRAAPDDGAEAAMVCTLLDQEDVLPLLLAHGRDPLQADRAEAVGGGQHPGRLIRGHATLPGAGSGRCPARPGAREWSRGRAAGWRRRPRAAVRPGR